MAGELLQAERKRGPGRPRLSIEEKIRNGTYRPGRERERLLKEQAEQPAPKFIEFVPDAEAKQDYIAVMRAYMDGVRSGKVVAGKWVKLAVARQLRDEERAAKLHAAAAGRADEVPADGWGFAFSAFFAVKACAFIEDLPHVEGRWATAKIRLEPWQVFVVCMLFGWRHRSDSLRRRFTVLYLELARKNAKSTLAAGIALYHLLHEEEPGAQVICGATTGSQARIVFDIAKKMAERSERLAQAGMRTLTHRILYRDGFMKPINAKASTQDGLNPSLILLDEAHAQDFELHNVLKSAQGARDNSLMLCPTTAGYDLLSVGYAMHQTVRKILQQVVEAEHYLGLIYSIDYDDGDDWQDERVWQKANPMLGVTPKMDKFRQDFTDAKNTPSGELDFMVKQLSVWLGAGSAWLSLPKWDLCGDKSLTLERFIGRECCIGGDLSQSDDITAVAYTFFVDGIYWSYVQLYLPEDIVEERARKVPEYAYWVKLGVLKLTPGSMVDYNIVEKDIRANLQRFKVKDIAFDQYGSFQLVAGLFNDGHPARTETKNSTNSTPPARELESRVKHLKFRHDGNPALRWHASNVVVTRKVDGSLVPKKENADSPNKIDGIEAILRSLSGWLRTDPKGGGSKQFQAFVVGG
jgi:phage terminase large subunit-like protein